MGVKGFLKNNKDVLLVFLLFLAVISIMQFRVTEIIGFDGWLHMKMADVIKAQGFISEFPFTTESILVENYADLQLLFRVLLIPFTFFGLVMGAKIASVLFASLCFTFFYWYLRKNKVNYALFWTSLYFVASVDLIYRFLLPREMPIAILSLVLTLYFIDKKMYKSLFLASLLFTWFYSGFVFQLLVITIYFIINLLIRKRIDWKLIVYPIIGTILALVINPYFPKNIVLLYTQIVEVNLLGNLYNVEWSAWGLLEFLKFNWIFLVLFISALFLNIIRTKFNKNSLSLFIISSIFLVWMLQTRRMHEYFAPFVVLFVAFSLNGYIVKLKTRKMANYAAFVVILIIAIFGLIQVDKDIRNNYFLPSYEDGVEWLKNNAEDGSRVFINGYAFNYLFFHAPEFRYTHGIDLTYSYLYDKAKFERYIGVLQGKDPGYNIIKEDYDVDYVFVGKIKQDVKLSEYIIKYREDFEFLYEDENVGILRVK